MKWHIAPPAIARYPYVPAQSEDFERTEICPHPADLEQVHIVHPGAADAGCFAGISCGGNRHKAGKRLSGGGVSVRRRCGAGEAAGLYSGQQRRTAAHTGAHAKEPPVAGRGEGEVSGLV